MLFRDPSVDGLKTGHTEEAGYCLVASAERDGFRLVSVVMGTASEKSREQETTKLLQYGFRYFSGQTVFAAGQPLPESARKVWFGESETVELAPTEPLYVTLPLGRESAIQATLTLLTPLMHHLKQAPSLEMSRSCLANGFLLNRLWLLLLFPR